MKTKRIYGFNPEDSLIDTIRQQGDSIRSLKERFENDDVDMDDDDIHELIRNYETLEKETTDFITWTEEHREKYCEWLMKTKDTREI
jgi:hypothetical protein